ncbi:TetR/AcrR family transcriptional regulator [Leekyejoonella antrihumi]|uniref:TetR family transcriptional regulator n=1 Tax=Leekyejoonella antrihumi TaxID=1660198 RepID=A0A563DRK9_9MICO|nr:TetR/AcrR family transcriptional regulator [Leekyejoonella antrihumi]TWP32571.1 TetR family transcriptional regulator [Leekyejoonella antrihumi]
MSRASARDRLADAAFALFAEFGYEQTTVEEIAERAGVGRSSFFRYYRSKEDVIFPDHERLRQQVAARLATSNQATAITAVSDAVRLVMLYYVSEGERARHRYRLTSTIPALRDREIASVAAYQRLFREFIDGWIDEGARSALRAELMAATVVAAHNHVLRRYLRDECADPVSEVDAALDQAIALFGVDPRAVSTGTTVLAFETPERPEEVFAALRRVLEPRAKT